MSPREVDAMSAAEYRAFVTFANAEIKAAQRAARKRK